MNCIENEYHFVLVCPAFRSLRLQFLPTYYCSWPTNRKLLFLLQASSKNLTKKCGNFLMRHGSLDHK